MTPNKHTESDQRITRHSVKLSGPFSSPVSKYSKAGIMPLSPAVVGIPPMEAATVIVKTFSIGLKGVRMYLSNGFVIAYPRRADGRGIELFRPAWRP